MRSLTKAQRNRINACVFILLVYLALRQVLGALLAWLAPSGQMAQLGWTALVNVGALLLPCGVALALCPVEGRSLRLRAPRRERFAFWLPVFLGGSALVNLLAVVLHPLDHAPAEILPGGVGPVLMVLVIYCVIPAMGEELLFRGVLEGMLTPCGKGIAVFVPALFFGLLHGKASQVFVAFLTGLFLGWLAWRSGSILLGMGLHLANNLLAVGEIYLTQFAPRGLTLAVQCIHFTVWPVAAVVLVMVALKKGKLNRAPGTLPMPGPLQALGVPACGLTVAVLLLWQVLESMGGMA